MAQINRDKLYEWLNDPEKAIQSELSKRLRSSQSSATQETIDWGKIFDWAKKPETEMTTGIARRASDQQQIDWGKFFSWAREPEPEPPKPSVWQRIKEGAKSVLPTTDQLKEATQSTLKTILPSKTQTEALKEAVKNFNVKDFLSDPTGLRRTLKDTPVGKALDQFGKDVAAGVADFNMPIYRALESVGGNKVPGLNILIEEGKKQAEQLQAMGGTSLGSQVVRALPGAVASLLLAAGTGGASAAGQASATGGEAVRQAVMQVLKSPAFWTSAVRSYGSGYGEAIESGADSGTAIKAGLLQAIPQALIEQAGGIEQLPAKASEGILRNVARTALEEATEEVLQYPFEGLAKKVTYAPETPLFSTREQAIINPVQQAQAGLVGGIVGGILGGATGAVGKVMSDMDKPSQTQQEALRGTSDLTQPNILPEAETTDTGQIQANETVSEQTFAPKPGEPGYKKWYRDKLKNQMMELLADSDKAKDKVGWRLARETMERNNLDVFGEEAGKRINEAIFRPIKENETKRIKFINKYIDRVKKLNLTKEESKYVQMLGEGKITEDQLPANIDKNKIKNAIAEFRKIYDHLLNLANKVLVQNGYDPVPYRKNYFPHFDDPQDPFLQFMKALGFKVDNITLPTDIAGITHEFKPGKKWFGHFLQRKGDQTTFDALEGFERYLHGISDVIYHTNDIQRLRAFESAIRTKYAPENIKARIEEIENSDLPPDVKEAAIDAIMSLERGHLGSYVTELRRYTDNLAGKKSIEDRHMEHRLGRATYNFFDNIDMQVRRNMVGWNISSWLNNFIPLAQAGGGIKTRNLLKAARDTVLNYINNDGFVNQSSFLIRRRGVERLNQTPLEKIIEAGLKPMEFIDNITTEILVRGKYYDNIERGMTHEEAIRNADDYVAGAVGDRSKGALPTIFNAKNPLTKLFTMFQVEVNNQYSFLFKDLPREAKELGSKWLAFTLLKVVVGSYIYNELYEKLTGRRPIPDLIGTIKNALKQDTPLDGLKSVVEDVLEQTPFIGGILGGGRLPIQSALPDVSKMLQAAENIQGEGFTRENVAEFLTGALKNPLTYLVSPFGGGAQIRKTVEGLRAYQQGASMTDKGQMRFPIAQTPANLLRTALFGQYSTPEAREYFEENRRPLSEKQTQAVLLSDDPERQYRLFLIQREAEKIRNKMKEISRNANLSMAEKDKRIRELQRKLDELWATQ